MPRRGTCRPSAAAGIPLTWTPLAYAAGTWGRGYPLAPVAGPADPGWRHRDLFEAAIGYDTTIVHSTPLWPPASALRPGPRRLAYVTFEADRLPARWLAILRRFDGLLVPSQHSLQICRDSGLSNPVTVVPHIAPQAPAARRGGLRPAGRRGGVLPDRHLDHAQGRAGRGPRLPDRFHRRRQRRAGAEDIRARPGRASGRCTRLHCIRPRAARTPPCRGSAWPGCWPATRRRRRSG